MRHRMHASSWKSCQPDKREREPLNPANFPRFSGREKPHDNGTNKLNMSYLHQTHYRLLAQNASKRKLRSERVTSAGIALAFVILALGIACNL